MTSSAAESLMKLLPDIDPRLIARHVENLDARYFQSFPPEEVAEHIRGLAGLASSHPVRLLVRALDAGSFACTILSFDYPSVFSLIAGVLSSSGFDTEAGDVFTYAAGADTDAREPTQGHGGPSTQRAERASSETGADTDARAPALRRGLPAKSILSRRLIVDSFAGKLSREIRREDWEESASRALERVIGVLEAGGTDALARARRAVYEMAAGTLEKLPAAGSRVLYPVHVEMEDSGSACTRMKVVSQDTPFFLFTFSTALSLQGVSIEHVTIRTEKGRIEDEFEFLDSSGRAIDDPARVDRIKLSVLLTKQFTTFLGGSPDPLTALLRFESLVREIVARPEGGGWFTLLSDQHVLSELAQLLGASTYLWEDFIRLQYETLLPILRPEVEGRSFCEPVELLPERLDEALSGAKGEEDFARRLNAFKDREIYLYDLDHILTPGSDFLTLSRRLTALAEVVVDAAAFSAYSSLRARFGEPATVAGIPVRYAIMGLGKMGGAALGYASDIELLFVYSDSGSTVGPEVIDNAEFFDRMVKEVTRLIHAKQEGIFHVDLRLRPYGGVAGPLACSLESFCTYYARGGPAHSYERLALVRLRAVGGDRQLGARVERLRDDMVYAAPSIDLEEFWALRERQIREKARPRADTPGSRTLQGASPLNAKFSPGALVDLEYAVQILQVIHGGEESALRTPRIHEALPGLASIGVLTKAEADELVSAYHFFRRLINGLRMLRGSARDLFLPALGSDEYAHLARRTGYTADADLSPAQKLHLDFESHTAEVRAFMERRFGRGSLPGIPAMNVADLILSDSVPEEIRTSILSSKGFRDPARAYVNLKNLSGEAEQRSVFARLAVLACDVLSQRPDPDMALNNWERFMHSLTDPKEHLSRMLSQPARLEILLTIFSTSQFLADALVRRPELLDYIGKSETLGAPRGRGAIAAELEEISGACAGREEWRDALRLFRRKEILRIGARDVFLGVPTRTVMEELSELADGIIEASLRRLTSRGVPRFCIIAFGKLGGRELNYSSDIDLLGVFDAEGDGSAEERSAALMEELRGDLSDHTTEGYAYRVDLRLRPYGTSGQLVFPFSALLAYYGSSASLWELQALLKARTVAGDLALGRELLERVKALILAPRGRAEVISSIDRLRKEALRSMSKNLLGSTDIKVGLGGIRDIEFLVQGLQMIHAHTKPELCISNTLEALRALGAAGILPRDTADRLSGDYLFLRRLEHFLQLYEDRQTHSLPRDPEQLDALARRMLGRETTREQFHAKLQKRLSRVHEEYGKFASGI